MAKLRLCLLGLLFAALPSVAHAQGGWWDTIEEWSGPGPFGPRGFVGQVRVGCFTTERERDAATAAAEGNKPASWIWWTQERNEAIGQPKHPCLTRNQKSVSGYIDLRYMRASTPDDQSLFSDRPGELKGSVTINSFNALLMHQLGTSVSVGAGLGAVWFNGATLDRTVHSLTATPFSVSVTPFKFAGIRNGVLDRLSRIIVLNFEETLVFGSFRATDFNTTSTSGFRSSAELRGSYSMIFDLTSLIN